MDDRSLHTLLDSALAHEPPLGPVVQKSLWAGIRLRRRRRARNATAGAAAAAVIAVAIPAVTGTLGHSPARLRTGSHEVVVYIGSDHGDIVDADLGGHQHCGPAHPGWAGPEATCDHAGREDGLRRRRRLAHRDTDRHRHQHGREADPVGKGPFALAITPDGRTVYVVNVISNTVTPISTATNTAGKPIKTWSRPVAIDITPDGRTAYVLDSSEGFQGSVIPITTATNTRGKPIKVGNYPTAMAMTPDGRTLYVANTSAHTVTPISTATNTAEKPIKVGSGPSAIAITPDGKTAYVVVQGANRKNSVVPITTATNTVGKPIEVGRGSTSHCDRTRREDRLRPELPVRHGDPDLDGDEHRRKTNQGRHGTHCDRLHAGREDRLRGLPGSGHGDTHLHRDQHARHSHQGRDTSLRHRNHPLTCCERLQ